MEPPVPANEAARLDALRRYSILDTAPEGAFDDITRLAAQICQAPIAFVSFVDADRQWFKSRFGLTAEEMPRGIAFCRYTILQTEVMVVPDAMQDARFTANPLVVSAPHIRFYAGAPLVTSEGLVLGTLAVMDRVPRALSAEQIEALRVLSRQVVTQIELRRAALTQTVAFSELGHGLSAAHSPQEAAVIIAGVAQDLLGWDAFSLDLYSPETDCIRPVLTMDTMDNQRVVVPHAYTESAPSPMLRKTLEEGGQLLLRETLPPSGNGSEGGEKLRPFGDVSRPSASLLFVPIRSGAHIVGVLSIQSYTPAAYDQDALAILQSLADHCGGALERIHAVESLRESERAERRFRDRLIALLKARDDLYQATSHDDLCRLAVELGRSRLGFDRLGIWFLDADAASLSGSFGVDESGNIRDERGSRVPSTLNADLDLMLSRQKPYLFNADSRAFDGEGRVVGRANCVVAPLWDGDRVIGYISADNLLNRLPITERDCELLTLYASTVGHLSARMQAAEALRSGERRFRALIENSADAVALFAEDGTILYVSPATERILGYPTETMIGGNPDDFIHPDDQEFVQTRWLEAVDRPGEMVSVQARVRHENGSWRLLEGVFTNLLHDPSVRAIVTNFHDITERKHLEEQLLQSQKMEGIGRLAGGIAHDFNNLLTAILGYAELAEEDIPESHSAFALLANIQQAGERAAALTSQLLAFARKQIIAPRVFRLNELILDMDRILRRLIGEDIELATLPGQELWPIQADPGQLGQALMNLALNARDAMPRGGRLTIETTNIALDEAYADAHAGVVPGDYVMLAVSDTGIGIEESIQQHIFEPFFTTKSVGQGTGLGLAMCYGIVKQSGGHIWVYSEPGHGATFKIYLPRVHDSPVSAALPAPQRASAAGTETILLVEDEPMVLAIAAMALRNQGYFVLEAAEGYEALRIAAAHPGTIDLLVTDVVMPQMSGKTLAEQLKQKRPQVKVLYASGYTDNTIVLHGVLEAGVDFLQKPYTPGTLASRVREALESAS